MPNVEVRDADGKLIHTYEMVAARYGDLVMADDLIDTAKKNAIEDELVSEDETDKLTFKVVE